jgi:hypothetical protein
MDSKTKALTLLTVIIASAISGALLFTLQSTVKADTSTTTTANSESNMPITPMLNGTGNGLGFGKGPPMGFGMMGSCMERREHGNGPAGLASVKVSDDYIQNVTNIAENDADVQNLISQGYNVTAVKPLMTTTVDGNGNVAVKATTAELTLIGTNGRAIVIVDLEQAKVTKIITSTVTEITK